MIRRAVEAGLPPAWFGYRAVRRADLDDTTTVTPRGVERSIIDAPTVAANPLPRNVSDGDALPDDAGWWGYSMHDVPERRSGATYVATIDSATVTSIRDQGGEFVPAILSGADRSLELREIRWRGGHAAARRDRPVRHLRRATWILERSYHNHSHWLTAHLPKLLVLRDRGILDEVVFPTDLAPVARASLTRLGIDPADHVQFDETCNLQVDELTVVGNDRFRPELLRSVRAALAPLGRRGRRIYVSRSRASRRRLVNEQEIEAALTDAGFESVVLEDLDFDAQVDLMAETSILCGPHGAGLTNMIFCAEGTHVVEIADLAFPNPNFYATASALGLPYWLVPATGVGEAPLLERDMHVDRRAVCDVVRRIDAAESTT